MDRPQVSIPPAANVLGVGQQLQLQLQHTRVMMLTYSPHDRPLELCTPPLVSADEDESLTSPCLQLLVYTDYPTNMAKLAEEEHRWPTGFDADPMVDM
jgi:hypothetical protein